MMYRFTAEDGEQVSLSFPINNVPEEVILEDGRHARRLFNPPTSGPILRGKGWASKPERDAANRKLGGQGLA